MPAGRSPVADRTSVRKGAARPSPQATAAKRSPRARDGVAGVPEAITLPEAETPRGGQGFRIHPASNSCYNPLQTALTQRNIMSTTTAHGSETEVTILARILGNENGKLPADLARYILDLRLSERDKARMHDLAVRNQNDKLSPAEKEEMFAFGKASTLLSILKSKARRTLGIKLESRTAS